MSAEDLKQGDRVLLSDGRYGIIKSVIIKKLDKPETTYNFEVENFHTYYVGENSVLVHNAACTPSNSKVYSPNEIANKYNISVDQFHTQVKPEILHKAKPNFKVGKNPDLALNRAGDIAYQGAKGSQYAKGFQDTGLNIINILSKLSLK